MLRSQLGYVALGTVFVFFGVTCCAIAAIRQRSEIRILVWLGIWSGMYGLRMLAETTAVVAALPRSLQIAAPYALNVITYFILVAALLAWSELTLGRIRRFVQAMMLSASVIGIAGIGWFLITGSNTTLLPIQ